MVGQVIQIRQNDGKAINQYFCRMNTEIINIGNELLIGQVINTNAAWMASKMSQAGFAIRLVSVIPDDPDAILEALAAAESRSEIVLVTGGLGPTKDDLTKETFCKYFKTRLVFHEASFEDVTRIFSNRGIPMSELNRKQAEIPESSTPISNKNGTAPGMWFEKTSSDNRKVVFVSMPGVPFEMKPMLENSVIPMLKNIFPSRSIVHRTILTQGIGESFLSDILESWELKLPGFITLAYLPQPGLVRLRLSGTGDDPLSVREAVDAEVKKLYTIIPDYIYGEEEDLLEEIIGKMLTDRGATLSTAESCTGGYIAHLITSIPGSSGYFKGSIIAYSNEVKSGELNVKETDLVTYGAVSEQVVIQMALGVQKKLSTTYSIATSGIAGPAGGTNEKPVGLTWIAVAGPSGVQASSFLFGENRERNIRKTALEALNLLRKQMLDAGC